MKNKFLSLCLVAEILVLLSQWGASIYPLSIGEDAYLEVTLRDPRDMFRGNYVDLELAEIEHPSSSALGQLAGALRKGDTLYVPLKSSNENPLILQPSSYSKSAPSEGRFIKGKLSSTSSPPTNFHIIYGIDQYFANPDRARALEGKLVERNYRIYAHVKITPGGNAALVGLVNERLEPL